MKNRFLRWITDHEKSAWFLFSIPLCVSLSWLLVWLKVGYGGILILNVFILFATLYPVQSVRTRFLNDAIRQYQNLCDPDVFLQECKRQLVSAQGATLRTSLLINYYTAQSGLGQFKQAYDGLIALNLDQSTYHPYFKFVYYNNLSDICENLGLTESAEDWYQKAIQTYEKMRPRFQKVVGGTKVLLEAQACIRNRTDLDRALQSLNGMNIRNLYTDVCRTITRAQVYLLQNRIEEARADLNYVIEHGNKLAMVSKAKELLKGIEQS